MKKISRAIVGCIFIIASSGCGVSERDYAASVTFYDEYDMELALLELDSSNIPYKLEENRIWYQIDRSDDVEVVLQRLDQSRPIPFAFPQEVVRDKYVELLDKEDIESVSRDAAGSYAAYVSQSDYQRAAELFRRVITRTNEGPE